MPCGILLLDKCSFCFNPLNGSNFLPIDDPDGEDTNLKVFQSPKRVKFPSNLSQGLVYPMPGRKVFQSPKRVKFPSNLRTQQAIRSAPVSFNPLNGSNFLPMSASSGNKTFFRGFQSPKRVKFPSNPSFLTH